MATIVKDRYCTQAVWASIGRGCVVTRENRAVGVDVSRAVLWGPADTLDVYRKLDVKYDGPVGALPVIVLTRNKRTGKPLLALFLADSRGLSVDHDVERAEWLAMVRDNAQYASLFGHRFEDAVEDLSKARVVSGDSAARHATRESAKSLLADLSRAFKGLD